MTRPRGRRKPCDVADARARHDQARQFIALAHVAEGDDDVRAAEATLLIDAGIASADAICCVRLGERSADGDHGAAASLLGTVDRDAARRLQTLLSLKTMTQYGTRNPSKARLAAARRAAAALFDAAAAALAEV